MRAKEQAPTWVRAGALVIYYPVYPAFSPPEEQGYGATVETDPFTLGDGSTVVHLCDLEESYRTRMNGRSRVIAASTLHLDPCPGFTVDANRVADAALAAGLIAEVVECSRALLRRGPIKADARERLRLAMRRRDTFMGGA